MHRSLQQLYQARDLVPFVGTGVSVHASRRNPLASWYGLLRDGVKVCAVGCAGLPTGWKDSMLAFLETGDLITYLTVAEEVHRRLDREGEFASWVRKVRRELTLEDTSVIDPLIKLSRIMVTTNYDLLLEKAIKQADHKKPKTIEIGDLEAFRAAIGGKRRAVIHVHGSLKSEIVLSASQYEKVRSDEGAKAIQESLLLSHQLLFVGVGEGLHDPNIGDALKIFSQRLGETSRPNFLLVRGQELEETRTKTRELAIVPVAYGSDYSDLAPFLTALASGSDLDITQDPESYVPGKAETRTGILNIAAFSEDELEDLVGELRRAERAMSQIESRLELPKSFAGKAATDQLMIHLQQLKSVEGPVSRLFETSASIAEKTPGIEAEFSKLAMATSTSPHFQTLFSQLTGAASSVFDLATRSDGLSAQFRSRTLDCQEFVEAKETMRAISTQLSDATKELSDLVEQLQDQDSGSLVRKRS